MIAIVDSGSTKADWVIIENHQEILRTETIGFNPLFIEENTIINEIKQNQKLTDIAHEIQQIYFYGAGVKNGLVYKVQGAFQVIFKNAKIHIESDLKAACLSVFRGKPSIVCILGTGSNTCFFDGEKIMEHTPSLGFILGDEGSGNHLGKMLLRDYFTHKMPTDLKQDFFNTYQLTKEIILEKVYKNKLANTYLASFNRFVVSNIESNYMQSLVKKCFYDFVEYQILPCPQKYEVEVNFIGSIAFYYKDILLKVMEEYQLKVGEIIQKPIDGLVEYHKTRIKK